MHATTLSSKGQLVIPLEVRRMLGLRVGDRFLCDIDEGRIVLVPEAQGKAACRMGEDGLPILTAPAGAPEMTPELVKQILSE
jgi:AbrB family looped-hinge helix DNA binding protein